MTKEKMIKCELCLIAIEEINSNNGYSIANVLGLASEKRFNICSDCNRLELMMRLTGRKTALKRWILTLDHSNNSYSNNILKLEKIALETT